MKNFETPPPKKVLQSIHIQIFKPATQISGAVEVWTTLKQVAVPNIRLTYPHFNGIVLPRNHIPDISSFDLKGSQKYQETNIYAPKHH